MTPAILVGEYELTIDEKNRLSIPSDIRKSLQPDRDGEKFYVVVGSNKRPWLYPELYWKELARQLEQSIATDDEVLEFEQMMFARARPVEWDNQFRVLLPDKTLKRTGVGREVTLIGVRDHLELWNRSDWDAREEELAARMPEIIARARRNRISPPPAKPETPPEK